jgi:hypothetical protein
VPRRLDGPRALSEVWSATAAKTVAIAEASEGLSGSLRCAGAIASAAPRLGLCVALSGSCALYGALGAIPVRSLWAIGVRSALLILRVHSGPA